MRKIKEKTEEVRIQMDYYLYPVIAGLTFASTVTDWKNPQTYIGITLAMAIALKAKRSGNGKADAG